MRKIALTGGIACGKSTVGGWLREMGAEVIDSDLISHALTSPAGEALPALWAAFGERVRNADDTLNRQALGTIVFADDAERARLNGILHPLIEARMAEKIADCQKNGLPIVILEVPLLYEADMAHIADEVWCISAPYDIQVQRLMNRNGLSREQAEARIRSQWPLAAKEALADVVIDTGKPEAEVREEVSRIYAARRSSGCRAERSQQ